MNDNRKDLLFELVKTNFKLRYNNSLLGFVWVLLKPLLTFTILYFVFRNFRSASIQNYEIYLLSGIILYTFFSENFVFGLNSLLDKAGIILKVNFPRELAVISASFMALINLGINLLILGIFAYFNPISPTPLSILYFVYILLVFYIGMLSISLFSSIILIKLRDLQHIADLLVQLLFYATPIFYTLDILPENAQKVISLNPLTIIIVSAREALIHGRIMDADKVFYLYIAILCTLAAGVIFFNKQVKRVAEDF